MNRVVPVGDGTYVEVDENGVPVGAPYNPLETFGLMDRSSSGGGTTTIGVDGKVVAAPTMPSAPTVPSGEAVAPVPEAGPVYDTIGSTPRRQTATRAAPGNSGAYQAQQTYDPVFGGGAPAGFGGSTSDPFANAPNYLNGQRHPAAGGAPLTPGGIFAQQDDGYDNRQQVTSTSGASAGPFGVNAAPAPRQSAQGGGTFFNEDGFSGGGGGGGSPMYQQMRAKGDAMAAKLKGYGGGGTSSGDDYTDPTRQYRRQGRRMDRAYERYNDELADPDPMRVTGWSKDQGIKPGTVDAVLDSPETLLPFVFSGFQGNSANDSLASLPMTDLAMMSFGTRGRDLMSKTPVVKPPRILRQNGVKPAKPDYRMSLDSSKTANKIAEMYRTIGSPSTGAGGDWFQTSDLLGNLATADEKSAVRQGLEQQFRFSPGNALDSIRSYVNSAFTTPLSNTGYARALGRQVDRQVMAMAPSYLTMKPKQADAAINTIARSFLD